MESQAKKTTPTTFNASEEASNHYQEFVKRGVTLQQLNDYLLEFALGIELKHPTLVQPNIALHLAHNLTAEVLTKLNNQRMQVMLDKHKETPKPKPPTAPPKTKNPVIQKAKKTALEKTKRRREGVGEN